MAKRGRPALSSHEPSTDVCVKMPLSLYDLAYDKASTDRVTVPEVVRRALRQLLSDERGGVCQLGRRAPR